MALRSDLTLCTVSSLFVTTVPFTLKRSGQERNANSCWSLWKYKLLPVTKTNYQISAYNSLHLFSISNFSLLPPFSVSWYLFPLSPLLDICSFSAHCWRRGGSLHMYLPSCLLCLLPYIQYSLFSCLSSQFAHYFNVHSFSFMYHLLHEPLTSSLRVFPLFSVFPSSYWSFTPVFCPLQLHSFFISLYSFLSYLLFFPPSLSTV